jgi:hypothetical protein
LKERFLIGALQNKNNAFYLTGLKEKESKIFNFEISIQGNSTK